MFFNTIEEAARHANESAAACFQPYAVLTGDYAAGFLYIVKVYDHHRYEGEPLLVYVSVSDRSK